MSDKFEKRTSSRAFWLMKMIADILIVNILFVFTSVLSLFVLFFPGLVSLNTVIYRIINNEYYHPFTTFFTEIKAQWSYMWRLELLGMGVLIAFGGLAYGYYAYIQNVGYDWIIWIAIIIAVTFALMLLSVFFHLLIFNEYFKDDTFWMMIRKSAVIARRKIWKTLLMLAFFLCFVVICIIVPYIIPLLPFSLLAFINQHFMRKTYENLVLEEEKRMAIPENLFLPVKVKEEEKEDNKQ